jgi:glucose-6-phosphate isomerase
MESLGKKEDLSENIVHQGLVVYGNKGSTDQHAYVQQLVDGANNFFVTFIEVLRDREGDSMLLERAPKEDETPRAPVTSGDYLAGFLLGTRQALANGARDSLTLTIDEVSPFTLGVLIALYERTVGFYASLIGINAYDQPGVEAGKLAAERSLDLQESILKHLKQSDVSLQADQIAEAVAKPSDAWLVYKLCNRLAANGRLKRDGSGAVARFSSN